MNDEVPDGCDQLSDNLVGESAEPVERSADEHDDEGSSHTHSQRRLGSSDSLQQQFESGALAQLPAMSDRDRRHRQERACSNASATAAAQSRNHVPFHRRHSEHVTGAAAAAGAEVRNRHRDRSSMIGVTARNRALTAGSATARAAAAAAAFDTDAIDDEADELVDTSTAEASQSSIVYTDFSSFITAEDVQTSASSSHNWQATKSSVRERLCFVFGSEVLADVHFLVGRGSQAQRIPAHKFVLSVGSAVFDAMFNGAMAVDGLTDIELPDVEPAAFISMLRFLYTDEVRLTPEIVMQCLYTAKKYAVLALERACVDYLKRNLCSDNAFTLLTQARLFDEPQLMAMCLETIDKTTSEALAADGFTEVDLETLCTVLERDTLGIKESKLFAAVCRWAEVECERQQLTPTAENKRQVLGSRALGLIRFPLMSIQEFAEGPAQSGLLTDRESVDMFLYFTVTPKHEVKFLETPRCCLTGKEQVVSRFTQIQTRWGYNGTSDRVRFVVNRKIFIVGFGLYGSIDTPSEYSVNIQILHSDTSSVCAVTDTSFMSDGSKSTFRVLFKEPVEIQPSVIYTACATLKGHDSYYGTKGVRKITHDTPAHDATSSSGRVIFQFSYATGNNNGTSVEDGQIPEIVFYT